ncbi:MAG TPA: hypothetical protein PK443_00490 [bacterium]|nr:hypothetical protein [bacterium]
MIKIYPYMLLLFLFSCAAGSVGDFDTTGDPKKLSREQTLSYRYCELDSDCTYANNGCCDCANGGETIAVNIIELTDFTSLFECENVSCTEIAPSIPCDQGTAKCVDGICEFYRDRADLL